MSQGPRHINTDRSLNRPTEQRPTEASALHQVSLSGQPDFFQPEEPAAPQELPKAKARPKLNPTENAALKRLHASGSGETPSQEPFILWIRVAGDWRTHSGSGE